MTAEYNCPPTTKPVTHKLSPEQRHEVNNLIAQAQDDLEAVLFELVGQRDEALAKNVLLRQQIEQVAYWSRSRTETRITLRDRIAKILT